MTDHGNTGVLQLFTREPVPGKTKTRLIPVLGAQGAADLHNILLLNTIDIATRSEFNQIELWSTSSSTENLLNEHRQRINIQCHKQRGKDLGQRMDHALSSALIHFDFAVIIGTDIPMLDIRQLDKAYQHLSQGADAVMGPAEDGGYYLIGIRKHEHFLFDNIAWGSPHVADQTRMKMNSLGWQWEELEILWDVDTPEDYERLKGSDFIQSDELNMAMI